MNIYVNRRWGIFASAYLEKSLRFIPFVILRFNYIWKVYEKECFICNNVAIICMYAEDCYVSFTKGQRATIILPVAPDAEKGRYYKLDRVENRQIIFEEEVSPRARMRFASSEAVRPLWERLSYRH